MPVPTGRCCHDNVLSHLEPDLDQRARCHIIPLWNHINRLTNSCIKLTAQCSIGGDILPAVGGGSKACWRSTSDIELYDVPRLPACPSSKMRSAVHTIPRKQTWSYCSIHRICFIKIMDRELCFEPKWNHSHCWHTLTEQRFALPCAAWLSKTIDIIREDKCAITNWYHTL
jgi:hypothetical protein